MFEPEAANCLSNWCPPAMNEHPNRHLIQSLRRWGKVFGDVVSATTIGRLVHDAKVIGDQGDS